MIFKNFRKKWTKWSLPSKFTIVGTIVGIIAFICSLMFYIFPLSQDNAENSEFSHLNVKMRIHYGSFFRISIQNVGDINTSECRLKIMTWRKNAFDVEIIKSEIIPVIIPGDDWIYDIDIFEETRKHSGEQGRVKSSILGFFSIACNNFDSPLAWSFYIPKENEWSDYNWDNMQLIKFDYSNNSKYIVDNIWIENLEDK